jgi:hypothetical protein
MLIDNWRDEAVYAPLAEADGSAWAWEFLRRDPRYQAEWSEFDRTWQALEAAYGSPPNRDFCAWKEDPRAWIRVDETHAGECRVDHDKVLIECAFGARWGFYKFPPDPRDAAAAREHRIAWRELTPVERVLGAGSSVSEAVERAAVSFDLDLPLKPQLEQVRRELAMLQRWRRRELGLRLRTISNLADILLQELRILDAQAAGELSEALPQLGGESVLASAQARRDGGYMELPWLPR